MSEKMHYLEFICLLALVFSGSWDGISSHRCLCTFDSFHFAIVCTIIITEKMERGGEQRIWRAASTSTSIDFSQALVNRHG
jgi:hypothetical protein